MLSLSSGPSGSEKTTPPAAEMSRVTAFANFFYTNFFRVELRGSSEARTEQAHLSEAKMSVAKGVIPKQA